ncbi:tetratricopeptide repeat-containing sensor histidine kinase [Marivirga sp. S37H4]|uniref:histidine kinase n=1 Tax=Marivirga aurantiaca TaxID=2802615 RepID=A0A935C9Q8_9BACT|nr:ATP-binding protein [Marivirga aurantiaca]MBK6266306.1 tetratricopeptide repeat-containing sensor histidine kinase [Marivirga aurantiaca]
MNNRRHKFLLLLCLLLPFTSGHILAASVDIEWYQALELEIEQKETEALLNEKEVLLYDARDLNRNDLISRFLKELAFIHLYKTKDLEAAMGYLMEALNLDEISKQEDDLMFTYFGLSIVFQEVDDYFSSAEFLEQAIQLNRKNKSENLQIILKQNLGEVYTSMNATDKAFNQYQDILKYAQNVRYPELEAKTWMKIALLEQLNKDYESALNSLKNALSIQRRINDKENEAHSLHAIGRLYVLQGEKERAMDNFKVSLNIWKEIASNSAGTAATYNSVAELYLDNKQPVKALGNLQIALNKSQTSQNQELIKNTYQLLSKTYKAMGEYQKALEYQELFMALEDFMQKEKEDRSILKMQNRYLVNQKQSTIDVLEFNRIQKEFELEEQKRSKNFIVILFILALVILVLILSFFLLQKRNNKRLAIANTKVREQNEQLQELNATKDKFFSIIGHDLKGPLNSLTSFSSLLMHHTESLSKEEIQMLATDLDKSLKNLFALLENLLEWSRSQTGNIEFNSELFDLTELLNKNALLLKQQAENKKITVAVKTTEPVAVKAHENSINTVIRNLLSNAIKFTPEGGQIHLSITEKTNQWVVSVSDNGVGMPPEVVEKIFRLDTKHSTQGTAKEKGTGLGLILCKEFVEKNGGEIWVKSEEGKGSVFHFSLPKN